MRDTVTSFDVIDDVHPGAQIVHQQLAREQRGLSLKYLKLILNPTQWEMWQRNTKKTGSLGRGTPNRRVIARSVKDGLVRTFHATKGPRSYRVPA